ncbi:MAG: glycosyltransferase [Cyclobacteriaceae bacterium]|nr:glycosyltransferase [Cyclobacteriaceae bacterium]UYN85425.1 MAG: glycosyltransferase [Cyclobacteriaceae bacterium]
MPQVNKISRIVIASVLKPVDETRMFAKIGTALAQAGHEVHIIGFPTQHTKPDPAVKFHPIANQAFSRLSLTRLLTPFKALRIALQVRPDYLIITTHELLFMAWWCKLITGCKVIYDVQENYYRNIRFTNAFPAGMRIVLACWVRLKERLLHPIIHVYLLAEKGYQQELRFAKPHIILQNKITRVMAGQFKKEKHTGYSRLLFSGTLAETTGVFHAIQLAEELHNLDNNIHLTLIGHCTSHTTHLQLLELARQKSCIDYRGSEHPVPHKTILKAVGQADFGIVWYPPNPSTACSIPTKLFEYLGLNLAILVSHTPETEQLVQQQGAGIILAQPVDYQKLLMNMKTFSLPQERQHSYFDEDVLALVEALGK